MKASVLIWVYRGMYGFVNGKQNEQNFCLGSEGHVWGVRGLG